MTPGRRFRERLAVGPVIAPSCWDGLSCRLAQMAGLDAIHLSGASVEMALAGVPDLGVLGLGELASHVSRLTACTDLPMIVDIDTGFGGVLSIQRSVREIERAGAAGLHLEDQANPKGNPLTGARKAVSRAEALDRVKAALDARTDPDFVIIAKTEADTLSDAELFDRCAAFLEAGADMVLPMFMTVGGQSYFALSPDEQARVVRDLPGRIGGPAMYMGVAPPAGMSLADVAAAGWAFIPVTSAMSAAANAIAGLFGAIREGEDAAWMAQRPGPYSSGMDLMRLFDLDRHGDTLNRFAHAAGQGD